MLRSEPLLSAVADHTLVPSINKDAVIITSDVELIAPRVADDAVTSTVDEEPKSPSSPTLRSRQVARHLARRSTAHRKGDKAKGKAGIARPKRVLLETKVVNDVETRDLKNPPSDTEIVSDFLFSNESFQIVLSASGLTL